MDTATIQKRKSTGSRQVEELFRQSGFVSAECYEYNSASWRLLVFDERFRGKSQVQREEVVEPILKQLPEDTQEKLFLILLLAPGEETTLSNSVLSHEFCDPSPSLL